MLQRLVVKPDQLIKRRGKLGLVGINLTLDQVKVWLKQRLGQETTVSAACAAKPSLFPSAFSARLRGRSWCTGISLPSGLKCVSC